MSPAIQPNEDFLRDLVQGWKREITRLRGQVSPSIRSSPLFFTNVLAMTSRNLVALAAEVRKVLASPISNVIQDEAGRRARKELLNTLPDLQRALEGPKETIVKTTWSVSQEQISFSQFFIGS